MKKRFLGFIFVFILIMSMNYSVYASDDNAFNIPTAGTYEYYSCFYNNSINAQITDKIGNNVTEFFVSKTKEYFINHDLNSIKKFMAENELVAHLYHEEVSPVQVFAIEQYKTVYDTMATTYRDNKYGTTMDFACRLSGGMWYNPNTYEVTRTDSPSFTVTYMAPPANIYPFTNAIATGSNVVSGKAYFWARFHVTGQGFLDPPGTFFDNYDYGIHTISFYATP